MSPTGTPGRVREAHEAHPVRSLGRLSRSSSAPYVRALFLRQLPQTSRAPPLQDPPRGVEPVVPDRVGAAESDHAASSIRIVGLTIRETPHADPRPGARRPAGWAWGASRARGFGDDLPRAPGPPGRISSCSRAALLEEEVREVAGSA